MITNLKAMQLQSRKDRDTVASNLLTALIGEASMIGKNAGNRESTDEEVVRVIKKFRDNALETLKHLNENTDAYNNLNREIDILETFMPAQLSEDNLREEIKMFKYTQGGTASVGDIMKYLQTNFTGLYDGKLASTIAKEV